MLAKLTGKVDSRGDNWVIIDVQGAGYLVSCSSKTLSSLPSDNEKATLHIETIVRQDMIQLFGFADPIEKEWFNLLTTVQGVGMKVALAILSALNHVELDHALTAQDKAMLSRAEGVGPKLAARIANELKDKRPNFITNATFYVLPTTTSSGHHEAVSALINLGYRRQEAMEAVAHACQNSNELPSVEEMIRIGLSKLARA